MFMLLFSALLGLLFAVGELTQRLKHPGLCFWWGQHIPEHKSGARTPISVLHLWQLKTDSPRTSVHIPLNTCAFLLQPLAKVRTLNLRKKEKLKADCSALFFGCALLSPSWICSLQLQLGCDRAVLEEKQLGIAWGHWKATENPERGGKRER